MNKSEFYDKYGSALALETKSWDFIEKGNRKNGFVAVSGFSEIDKDFLYYNYTGVIWELDLNKVYNPLLSLRNALKTCLDGKKDLSDFILYSGKGKNSMVEVMLSEFGTQIESVSKAKITTMTTVKSGVELDLIGEFLDIDPEIIRKVGLLSDILREIPSLGGKTTAMNSLKKLLNE